MYFKVESSKDNIPGTASLKVRSGGGGRRRRGQKLLELQQRIRWKMRSVLVTGSLRTQPLWMRQTNWPRAGAPCLNLRDRLVHGTCSLTEPTSNSVGRSKSPIK